MSEFPVLLGITLTIRTLGAILFWTGLFLDEGFAMLLGIFLYGTQVGWW